MDHLSIYLIYLGAGALSGFAGGLFGIGGGVVTVPALLACFSLSGVPPQAAAPMAVGTSLACVGFTNFLAARAHAGLGNLGRAITPKAACFALFLAAGMGAGAVFSTRLPHRELLALVGAYQAWVAVWMLGRSRPRLAPAVEAPAPERSCSNIHAGVGSGFFALAGAMAAVTGTGSATLLVPFFSKAGLPFRRAAALSSFYGCAIGVFGAVAYAAIGSGAHAGALVVGFVSLPAFLSLAAGGFLLVGVGAKVSMRFSPTTLSRAFGTLLLATSASLLMPMARAVSERILASLG